MITFGRKLKHLRQKNHLTQKELGMAVGLPDSCADVRIAQYESDVRTPKEDLNRVGGGFRRRPLTPPDMRFRIRRFS